MKKKMMIAGLLAAVMVLSLLLISCGADEEPVGVEESVTSVESVTSSGEVTGSDSLESGDSLESSGADETSSVESNDESDEPDESDPDEIDPGESSDPAVDPSESSVADEDPSEPESSGGNENSESNASNTPEVSEPDETSKPVETGTGTHKHSYKDTVVKPTCTEKGYTLHKCSCGDSYKDKEVDALGHNMIVALDFAGRKNPTDTERGARRIGCDNAGCNYYEDHEIYSYNEVAPLIAERVLYYINTYRKEAGVAPAILSKKLCEYAQYRSMQTFSHDRDEQKAAANATQCGDFYEYWDMSYWEFVCSEVITGGTSKIIVDDSGETIDDAVKSVISAYKKSTAHWSILMNSERLYMGVGQKGHNCIVMASKNYDEGYQHIWDFGDGNCGVEWITR